MNSSLPTNVQNFNILKMQDTGQKCMSSKESYVASQRAPPLSSERDDKLFIFWCSALLVLGVQGAEISCWQYGSYHWVQCPPCIQHFHDTILMNGDSTLLGGGLD